MIADIPGNNNSTSMESSTICSTPVKSHVTYNEAKHVRCLLTRNMFSHGEATSVGIYAEGVTRLKPILPVYRKARILGIKIVSWQYIDRYTIIMISIPLS